MHFISIVCIISAGYPGNGSFALKAYTLFYRTPEKAVMTNNKIYKLAIMLISAFVMVLLAGCDTSSEPNSASQSNAPSSKANLPAETSTQSESQIISEDGEGQEVPLKSNAIFVPLGLPEPEPDWPVCVNIVSEPALDAFYEENLEALGLDYGPSGQRFFDIIERYDETYFQSKALVLVLFGESDSSTTHSLESVMGQDGALQITIRRDKPEIVLTALAQWAALVEVDAQYGEWPANVVFVQ